MNDLYLCTFHAQNEAQSDLQFSNKFKKQKSLKPYA